MRPDYVKFFSGRVSWVEPSPIREFMSRVAKLERQKKILNFTSGQSDPDVVPRELYIELSKDVFSDRRSVLYSATEGIAELREEIAKFMERYEGVKASPESIIVTLGGSQALDLIGRLMVDPGDIIIVENPSYVNTLLTWKQWGAKLVGVRVDENGMDTYELESIVRRLRSEGKPVKLVYTIPTGQNPSGVTMSNDRRKHLLEIASQYDLLVIEDGAYNYLVYEPIDVRSIKSMDKEDRVIFVGTFSKVLGPGLRVGWLQLPEELVELFKAAKGPTDMCAPVPSQLLVLHALRRGLFEEARRKAVAVYREKRDAMLKAIESYMPGLKHTRPVAGMFVMVWLPSNIDGEQFAEEALEKYSVAVIPAKSFFTDESGRNVIRLNFTMVSIDDIEEGIKRLGMLLKEKIQH
jgi:2-aminoadipate transaminase